MRRPTIKVLLIAALLMATPASVFATGYTLASGDDAPPLRGKTLVGDTKIVDFSANKLTLINFWATWCEPCRAEMPELEKVYGAQQQNGLEIFGVLYDDASNETVQQFLDGLDISYPIIRPHKRFRPGWVGTSVLPCSFLINRDGVIVRRYVGATPEQVEGLVFDVNAFLADEPLGPVIIPETPAAVSAPGTPVSR